MTIMGVRGIKLLLPIHKAVAATATNVPEPDPVRDYKPEPERAGDEVLKVTRISIPMEKALLCLDCECIHAYDDRPGYDPQKCPACGSNIAWAIGRALNRGGVGGEP